MSFPGVLVPQVRGGVDKLIVSRDHFEPLKSLSEMGERMLIQVQLV